MKLKLAENLTLPAEAVTQTFAILAKRGVGKTYAASVMAEEMLKAGQQVVAIDPTGAWWGLRSSFSIAVFGGDHADLPLEESAGEVIANAIVEHRFSAVLDLAHFRKGQLIRFMTAFAESLYRLNREALHLFVDEADAVAPQGRSYGGDENRMLGAMEDIVRRGRKRGLGCTLITQRPAVLNKNVLTQCESLFAMRLVHPKDIDAIMEWINVHADPAEADAVVKSLPTLGIGEAWFWSPGWLGALKRVKIRERETFDSSATPKPGERAKAPKELAALDLAALGDKIKSSVETAKANDPKELKRRLGELERQLKGKSATPADVETINRAVNAALVQRDREWQAAIKQRDQIIGNLKGRMTKAAGLLHVNGEVTPTEVPAARPVPIQRPRESTRAAIPPRIVKPVDTGDLESRPQRFLDAAATLACIGAEVTRETVSAWVGVHPRGGSVGEVLKQLEDGGYITNDRGRITITDSGVAAAGHVDPNEAIERAKSGLSNRQAKFFEVICDAYPAEVTREEIAAKFQIHPRGGSLGEDLGRLVGRGLVEGSRGRYRVRDFLFAK